MKDKIILVLKGMAMGFADVVPGVSGGTMALILGIYRRFIDALKSVDGRIFRASWGLVRGGFKKAVRDEFVTTLKAMDTLWLMTLAVGILMAFGIGSKVIPSLMERYPELMLAFFFGLVLASVSAPLRLLERFGVKEGAALVLMGVGAFFLVGGNAWQPPLEHEKVVVADVEEGGQTLKQLAEQGPSMLPPEGIYWSSENAPLRALAGDDLGRGLDPKAKDNPYNDLVVPAGTEISVPRPALWFVFVAGFFAICAMVLPGISGSFILLILGSYYFMLNALKGFIKALVHFQSPASQALYVSLFILGALLGLAVFSRLLSWLLKRFPSITMAALIGLMLGCLRAIWPFKERVDGIQHNVLPASLGGSELMAGMAFVVGDCSGLGTGMASPSQGERGEFCE